jgi:hypothetical protein
MTQEQKVRTLSRLQFFISEGERKIIRLTNYCTDKTGLISDNSIYEVLLKEEYTVLHFHKALFNEMVRDIEMYEIEENL